MAPFPATNKHLFQKNAPLKSRLYQQQRCPNRSPRRPLRSQERGNENNRIKRVAGKREHNNNTDDAATPGNRISSTTHSHPLAPRKNYSSIDHYADDNKNNHTRASGTRMELQHCMMRRLKERQTLTAPAGGSRGRIVVVLIGKWYWMQ